MVKLRCGLWNVDLDRGSLHTLSLDIRDFIWWAPGGDLESCATGGGRWFSYLLIIIDIIWARFLSPFFISLNLVVETVTWWASWFSILVWDLVWIRLLKRGKSFLGAIVNCLLWWRIMELRTMHANMMSWEILMQILILPRSEGRGKCNPFYLFFEY